MGRQNFWGLTSPLKNAGDDDDDDGDDDDDDDDDDVDDDDDDNDDPDDESVMCELFTCPTSVKFVVHLKQPSLHMKVLCHKLSQTLMSLIQNITKNCQVS